MNSTSLFLDVFGVVNYQQDEERSLPISPSPGILVISAPPGPIYGASPEPMSTNTSQRIMSARRAFSFGSVLSSYYPPGYAPSENVASKPNEHRTEMSFLSLDPSSGSHVTVLPGSERNSLTSTTADRDSTSAVVRHATRTKHSAIDKQRSLVVHERTELSVISRTTSQHSSKLTRSLRTEAGEIAALGIARPHLVMVAISGSKTHSIPKESHWNTENLYPMSTFSEHSDPLEEGQVIETDGMSLAGHGTILSHSSQPSAAKQSITNEYVGSVLVSRWSSTTASNVPSSSVARRELSDGGSSFSAGLKNFRPSSGMDLGTVLAENWPIPP